MSEHPVAPDLLAGTLARPERDRPDPGPAQLDDESAWTFWLQEFQREKGRALRVLHIGNIANNAYNNAKIQRQRGIAADVLSHDYYHIMACPEWEDAPFEGSVGDDGFPDWWAVGLKGFERPRWFAQGPLDASIRYLLAHTSGAPGADRLWRALQLERWFLVRKGRAGDAARWLFRRLTGREVAYVSSPANACFARAVSVVLGRLADFVPNGGGRLGAALRRRAGSWARLARTANLGEDAPRHRHAQKKHQAELMERAQEALEPIGKGIEQGDLDFYFIWWWHPYMRLLLRRYDIVQAYATYTMIPFIQGMTDYVAYEHGTIRAIPFQDTTEGRTCALTYRLASKVLITNSDNMVAAEALGIAAERQVFLPHAFDSDKLARFARENAPPPRRPGAPVVFFSPTRQHWVGEDPGWAKGNDRVIKALADLVREGLDCRLRLVEWGRDVQATRDLAARLGIADRIEWVGVMKKRQLWHAYLMADAVVDQFVVGAMGGVTFEAMMLGRRVVSAIDLDQTERFFGEAPPLFACSTSEEIREAMRRVVLDPDDVDGAGARNRDWMERRHSADRIVALQVDAYRRVLAARGAP